MSSISLSIQGQGSEAALDHVSVVPLDVVKRRSAQRRQMLVLQAISHSLITSVLLIYGYAGSVSVAIPAAYFLSGIGLIGFFATLSETSVDDQGTRT
jgi:hypothetical protein